MSHRRSVSPRHALGYLIADAERRVHHMAVYQEWVASAEPFSVSNTDVAGECVAGTIYTVVRPPGVNFTKFSGRLTGGATGTLTRVTLIRGGALVDSSDYNPTGAAPEAEMMVLWSGSDYESTSYEIRMTGPGRLVECSLVLRRRS